MAEKILIFGANGNSLDIVDIIAAINRQAGGEVWHCLGFLDGNPELHGKLILGLPVLGTLFDYEKFLDCHFVNGISSPSRIWNKEELITELSIPTDRYATLVHPDATVSPHATIGRGTVVFPQVSIASEVRIGNHVLILPGGLVTHGVMLGDFVTLAAGVSLSGAVRVGRGAYLGTNSAVRGGISIGDHSLIGMGSVVLHDVPRGAVYVGNPAKYLRPVRSSVG